MVGQSLLKLMNYVFYLILKSPNSYYENPDRYIRMQPVSICTVPVDKMRSLFMCVANQMIYTDYALLVLKYFMI